MFPLNPTLMRGLNDKLYEKRKIAALEIERWVDGRSADLWWAQMKRIVQAKNSI
jgi:hypothetical protein